MVVSLPMIGTGLEYGDDPATCKQPPKFEQFSKAVNGPRTSPYDPPTDDSFVTDDGPGLDTGCTFNTDSNHPLVIDVLIDKVVGPVDTDGYLIDADTLIDAEVIPPIVQVSMPAYDIDINGDPPERDIVKLNGETLGTLDGDDVTWKLNSFAIDIRKIRFPEPPAAGEAVTPRSNRITINIDTLSSGSWCAAIDWVAFIIPIKESVYALTLEPKENDHKVRVNDLDENDRIDVIFQQTLDNDCNIMDKIVESMDDYPFAGFLISKKEHMIHTKIETCPSGINTSPNVYAKWEINGTSESGNDSWKGLEGDVGLTMPDKIGSYTVTFDYTIDGQELPEINRKLYVVRSLPHEDVRPPRISWYDLATSVASGLTAKDDEETYYKAISSGLYNFGTDNWRYGYCYETVPYNSNEWKCSDKAIPYIEFDLFGWALGDIRRCKWEALVADEIVCDTSDCKVFKEVFGKMTDVLGISESDEAEVKGSKKEFVTKAFPSLDPKFPGNLQSIDTGEYGRYSFTTHFIREYNGKYYDVVFDKIYSSKNEIIDWNYDGKNLGDLKDTNGYYFLSDEGARIYYWGNDPQNPTFGYAYDSWNAFKYKAPQKSLINAEELQEKDRFQAVKISDTYSLTPYDFYKNGLYTYVISKVDIELLESGIYKVYGDIMKDGERISSGFRYWPAEYKIEGEPGIYTASLGFSGEDIFRSDKDGPYDLEISVAGCVIGGSESNCGSVKKTFVTPAYDHTNFGELHGRIIGFFESPVDTDGDGLYNAIEVPVTVNIASPGGYVLAGSMDVGNTLIIQDAKEVVLDAGEHTVNLQFPGTRILRFEEDGPYKINLSLWFDDDELEQKDKKSFKTKAYHHTDFEGLIHPDGTWSELTIDTNNNGLYDVLRVEFGADIEIGGEYEISGNITHPGNSTPAVRFASTESVDAGPRKITFDFLGSDIHANKLDGPYEVEIYIENTDSEATDRIRLPWQTKAYDHKDFEPRGGVRKIVLTGDSHDKGIDTDGNGLYDELLIQVEAEFKETDTYTWSARLTNSEGKEIDFYHTSGSTILAGAGMITFVFDGSKIGAKGDDGPYFVRGLLIHGNNGANLVSYKVAETAKYLAKEFEGYAGGEPPVAQCQDVTVRADAQCSANANINNGSYDPDGGEITSDQSPEGPYPLGDTKVTLKVVDPYGESDSCSATVTAEDKLAPNNVQANAPSFMMSITKQDNPVSFTATAEDNCSSSVDVQISEYSCYNVRKKDGKKTPQHCAVELSGDTITISKLKAAPKKRTFIEWTIVATDESGNSTEGNGKVEVVKVNPLNTN